METRADCIFCRIVAGGAPSHAVCGDELTLTFLDLFPAAPGHTLVVTREHFTDIFEASEEALAAVARSARRVAKAMRSALRPDGISVFQLNGAAAGQTVFHYHLHLLPRRAGEELRIHGRAQAAPEELEKIARAIRDAL